MASSIFNPSTGKARLFFRYCGKQLNRTIKVGSQKEADSVCGVIEEAILDLDRGKLVMPPNADVGLFIMSSGRVATCPGISLRRIDVAIVERRRGMTLRGRLLPRRRPERLDVRWLNSDRSPAEPDQSDIEPRLCLRRPYWTSRRIMPQAMYEPPPDASITSSTT
jgi:hypothetical protein